jgi:hypothetical protein
MIALYNGNGNGNGNGTYIEREFYLFKQQAMIKTILFEMKIVNLQLEVDKLRTTLKSIEKVKLLLQIFSWSTTFTPIVLPIITAIGVFIGLIAKKTFIDKVLKKLNTPFIKHTVSISIKVVISVFSGFCTYIISMLMLMVVINKKNKIDENSLLQNPTPP